MPGRTMTRPPAMPMHGSPLPFLHEPTGCSGHDLLVLNARPDLTPAETIPATEISQGCFSQNQP
jgi:hypothetical protein